ncbi:sensor histidine kinase [Candidatus Contubernalis alkaliaceticus]|uniref:sensor histidine kinase n=1 Tax=Candidatus Contubernalis alkaliaceticus TaxID=338645 RepID=UPI001F4C0A3A|nr:ATP-binding protein [Candidatus Contubernalis alkalaceticus]UNC91404.1 HAMP domain-containing protein [Candidatus Contubernalis alkalaceticus]
MKLGIRSKLITSFILVFLIPLVITGTLIFIFLNIMVVRNPEMQKIALMEDNQTLVMNAVRENFRDIGNYDRFGGAVGPLLEDYERLQVLDHEGKILFDSQSLENSLSHKQLNLARLVGLEEDSTREANIERSSYPIVVEGQVLATAVMSFDLNEVLSQKVVTRILSSIVFGLLVGLALLVLLIYYFSRIISGGILEPLKELGDATDSISRGNLDFEINYCKEDELGRLCQAFDIMRKDLKKSLEKQEAYDRSRKELVAVISHDLRTPIASIKGYVEGLQDGIVKDPEMFQRYLTVIRDKTSKLDHLIDDLFQYSQLELGKLTMEMKELDSRLMLENILEVSEFDFAGHPVDLMVNRPLPRVKLLADEHRISQVLDNILQNARRYVVGEGGRVEVDAVIKDNFIKITIRDNGPGIPQDDLSNLFDQFYRREKSRSMDYGGIGLGLAICKHIVEEHGGEIWVESRLGEGAAFIFTLPFVMDIKQ